MSKPLPLTSLILLGAGGHAKSCINLIESIESFSIQGILGRKEEVGDDLLGYKVIGTDNDLPNLVSESSKAIVTPMHSKTEVTKSLTELETPVAKTKSSGFSCCNILHIPST